MSFTEFFEQPFLDASAGDYIAFVAIILAALLLKKALSALVVGLTSRLATRFSDGKYRRLFCLLISKPLEWLFAIILGFYAFNFIEVPLHNLVVLHWQRKNGEGVLRASHIVEHLFAFTAIITTTLLISRLVDFFYRAQEGRAHRHLERERAQLLPLLRDVLKIALWTMGFFWLLGVVFHVNIPALITGLGIGGIALALAAKESIENLLASFTILADKPFVVDDTVRLGTLEGKVERIGFRSTRLRSGEGSLLIVPNKKLIDESLENLSERDVRKMRLSIPLRRGMPQETLESLIKAVRNAVDSSAHVQDGTNASIESFGENTVQLLVFYHLPDNLPEERIQAAKNEVNMQVYGIVGTEAVATLPDGTLPATSRVN